MNSEQQTEFIQRLAELAESGMPLPQGLRQASSESRFAKVSKHLRTVADHLESGGDWNEVLANDQNQIPKHVMGVIRGGIRCGNLGTALNNLLDQERTYRDHFRKLLSTLAYPLILLTATSCLLIAAMLLIVRPMADVFGDFGTELPAFTALWISLANQLPQYLLGGFVCFVVIVLAIRLLGGQSGWMRFLAEIPIFGPMIHFAGVAQMLRLLQIFVEQQVPLPEALRLTADGVMDANVRRVTAWLADGVESGVPMSDLVEATPRLPMTIASFLRWGENHNALAESMQSAYESLEGRIHLKGAIVTVVVGPLLLVFIGVAVGSLALAMFMPLISLIQNLT